MRLFIFLAFIMFASMEIQAFWQQMEGMDLITPESMADLEKFEKANTWDKLSAVIPNAKNHEKFVECLSKSIENICWIIKNANVKISAFDPLSYSYIALVEEINDLYQDTPNSDSNKVKIAIIMTKLKEYNKKVAQHHIVLPSDLSFKAMIECNQEYFKKAKTEANLNGKLGNMVFETGQYWDPISLRLEYIEEGTIFSDINADILNSTKNFLKALQEFHAFGRGTDLTDPLDKLTKAFDAVETKKIDFDTAIATVSALSTDLERVQEYILRLRDQLNCYFSEFEREMLRIEGARR